jgi:hypothetical protein
MSNALLLVLKNWSSLTANLHTLSEDQIKFLMDHEMANEPRKTFVERLHARYTMLRSQRERSEMVATIK